MDMIIKCPHVSICICFDRFTWIIRLIHNWLDFIPAAKEQSKKAEKSKILNGLNLIELMHLQSSGQKEPIQSGIKIEPTEDDGASQLYS